MSPGKPGNFGVGKSNKARRPVTAALILSAKASYLNAGANNSAYGLARLGSMRWSPGCFRLQPTGTLRPLARSAKRWEGKTPLTRR